MSRVTALLVGVAALTVISTVAEAAHGCGRGMYTGARAEWRVLVVARDRGEAMLVRPRRRCDAAQVRVHVGEGRTHQGRCAGSAGEDKNRAEHSDATS